MLTFLLRLTEQAGKQRYEGKSNKRDAAPGHELLDPLTFCTRVIISVAFQQVDAAPDRETGSEGDDEGLKNFYCTVEKIHK